MYAKSIIKTVQARALAGAWSRHLGFLPVAMALAVAVLPFTLQPNFDRPLEAGAPRAEPVAEESPFSGLVLASVVTAPKRVTPLNAQQRAVAGYIARKYGVSVEVVQEFVRTAFAAGKQYSVDPLLVVAVMAVESSYNPFAQSWAGAKGLMQIIPKYHLEKFVEFGGESAVFDPRVNIWVGARILREYLLMASGDLFTALQTYAGALADTDGIYTQRVLDEKDRLDTLAGVPKSSRVTRVVLQSDPARPGTLVTPVITTLKPVPEPVMTPAAPEVSVSPATGAPPPAAKAAEDAAQAPQPKQPAPPAPVNLTQLLPEAVRF